MAAGLSDFLKHIKNNPQNDTLIDRFTSLTMELDRANRQLHFEELFATLESANPHGALRAAYSNLQVARLESEGALAEVQALPWVEKAFRLLGKIEHAALVQAELDALKNRDETPAAESLDAVESASLSQSPELMATDGAAPLPPLPFEAIRSGDEADSSRFAEESFTVQRAHVMSSLYESFGQRLLDALGKQLQQFSGTAQSRAAAIHLIQSFEHVYELMNSTLPNARTVFGHNPLLIDEKDLFREDLVRLFVRSPLFAEGFDRMAAPKVRLLATLLTAWFDQAQHWRHDALPFDQQREHRKLLETTVTSVLGFSE